jgi:transposase InsO family protein
MDHIVRLHGISKTIISDRGTQFVARFWEQLHDCLGTKLIRNSSYHPQTDGQTERINQILEDMLRASILNFDKSWDKCLSLVEFSYNNSYQASLKMPPFYALYRRRCRTPLNWSEAGERTLFGPGHRDTKHHRQSTGGCVRLEPSTCSQDFRVASSF